jgi:hypothetical protein
MHLCEFPLEWASRNEVSPDVSKSGSELVDWLLSTFLDVKTREDALEQANKLLDKGLFVHVRDPSRRILDGYIFYRFR